MKQVIEMPTSGQFVAVWVFNKAIWSGVYSYECGYINVYSALDDEWGQYDIMDTKQHLERCNAIYFIAD